MHAVKPSYTQRHLIHRKDKTLDTHDWLVRKDCPAFIEIINKKTNEIKRFEKTEEDHI